MRNLLLIPLLVLGLTPSAADYTNFEVGHVHPIALTPSRTRLLVVNTPDAMLEVFSVQPDGGLLHERSVPVGLEPVSVTVRSENEAWVVNQLSDSVTIVDPGQDVPRDSVDVGDEPADVAFAGGRAFVSVAGENAVKVLDPDEPHAAPVVLDLFSLAPRALAVAPDGSRVYAAALLSGNRTTVLNVDAIFGDGLNLDTNRLAALGLNDIECDGPPAPYPPLPQGIARNPSLTDPPPGATPRVGLIVEWNESNGRWEDDAGQDWSHCLPFRLPDHDLFVIDSETLAVQSVDHLGTILFDVAVHPADGRVWVPNTEARNAVRFEHALGVQGHVVDNRVSVVDPADGFAVDVIDLNVHIDRASDPSTNLAERRASVSQPGMMIWNADGSRAWMTALGSRRVFRMNGECAAGECIFGAERSAPDAVEVGEGPTGIALHPDFERLYVLLRFSNTVAIVDASAMVKLDEVPLHDPSPHTVRTGRRFLYDAIDGSGHGDAACSSCHVFGDRDGLAWDLGDPTGEMVPYDTPLDNVRFIVPLGGQPTECPPSLCASHQGFDPQKGPMTTQTLRGMLEPLHWRGDRATMNDFNTAFVSLMGTADIGPIHGAPAGLPAAEMESFRQFALGIPFPPNPLRNLDDSLPDAQVPVFGTPFPGNPAHGEMLFDTHPSDAGQPCATCHTHPFGAGGGKLGGVTPEEPTSSDAAALFNGTADGSPHSDLKIPHLRNMYQKAGPRFGDGVTAPPLARSGFGNIHDGSIPDLGTFFSASVFALTPDQVRDVSAFMTHFPTGTKPAVGRELTLSAPDPTLATLSRLGDLADPERHCELTASTLVGGLRRHFRRVDGSWAPDRIGEPSWTTEQLQAAAEASVHVLCAPLGSGLRLGGDRDEDGRLNGDDCASADPQSWGQPAEVSGVLATRDVNMRLDWSGQAAEIGPGVGYAVVGGDLSTLRDVDPFAGATILASGLSEPSWVDALPSPPPGAGRYYLVRASNGCGVGSLGPDREP